MIRKKHKIILSFIGVALLIFVALYRMNSKGVDVLKTKPKFYVKAENLIQDFTLGKGIADSTIVEKVISVEGVIREINTLNNRQTIFLKGKSNDSVSVLCDMQTNQIDRIQNLKSGDTIRLKGVFKGFLKDVILLDCVISTKNE